MVARGRPTIRTGVNGSGDRRGAAGTRTRAHSVHTALWLLAAFALATGCHPSSAQTWDKVKEDLASRGITPSLVYDGNLLTDGAGGLKRDSIFQGNLYLQMRIDSEKAFGFPGMNLFFSELVAHGPNPEDGLVGDAQGVNNVTARPGFRTYENWVQYNFLDNHWSVLVGQYDLATEFYTSQTANLFFNSAFGTGTDIAPTGLEGPSIYPYTSLGGRTAYKPLNNVVFRTAILDGVPLYRPNDKISPFRGGDGLLIVSEAACAIRRTTPTNIHHTRNSASADFQACRLMTTRSRSAVGTTPPSSTRSPKSIRTETRCRSATAPERTCWSTRCCGKYMANRRNRWRPFCKSAWRDNRSIASVPIMAPALRQPGSFLDVRKTK